MRIAAKLPKGEKTPVGFAPKEHVDARRLASDVNGPEYAAGLEKYFKVGTKVALQNLAESDKNGALAIIVKEIDGVKVKVKLCDDDSGKKYTVAYSKLRLADELPDGSVTKSSNPSTTTHHPRPTTPLTSVTSVTTTRHPPVVLRPPSPYQPPPQDVRDDEPKPLVYNLSDATPPERLGAHGAAHATSAKSVRMAVDEAAPSTSVVPAVYTPQAAAAVVTTPAPAPYIYQLQPTSLQLQTLAAAAAAQASSSAVSAVPFSPASSLAPQPKAQNVQPKALQKPHHGPEVPALDTSGTFKASIVALLATAGGKGNEGLNVSSSSRRSEALSARATVASRNQVARRAAEPRYSTPPARRPPHPTAQLHSHAAEYSIAGGRPEISRLHSSSWHAPHGADATAYQARQPAQANRWTQPQAMVAQPRVQPPTQPPRPAYQPPRPAQPIQASLEYPAAVPSYMQPRSQQSRAVPLPQRAPRPMANTAASPGRRRKKAKKSEANDNRFCTEYEVSRSGTGLGRSLGAIPIRPLLHCLCPVGPTAMGRYARSFAVWVCSGVCALCVYSGCPYAFWPWYPSSKQRKKGTARARVWALTHPQASKQVFFPAGSLFMEFGTFRPLTGERPWAFIANVLSDSPLASQVCVGDEVLHPHPFALAPVHRTAWLLVRMLRPCKQAHAGTRSACCGNDGCRCGTLCREAKSEKELRNENG